MDRPLDELLSEYLDGVLSEADREAVEAILASDPQAKAALQEMQQVKSFLGKLPLPAQVSEPMPTPAFVIPETSLLPKVLLAALLVGAVLLGAYVFGRVRDSKPVQAMPQAVQSTTNVRPQDLNLDSQRLNSGLQGALPPSFQMPGNVMMQGVSQPVDEPEQAPSE